MELPTPSKPPRATVLVVDDQEANIQTVGTLLRSYNYDVMSAMNAEQAVQRLNAKAPNIILMDMMMPGVSGLELCRQLKSQPEWKHIPVIFLSAAGEVNLITAALEAGAVDYVTKPFHRAELLSRVHTHLTLKAANDELRSLAKDKEELLNLMAHDIKNWLAALQLNAEFLSKNSTQSQPLQQCATTIKSQADSMVMTINDLLANQGASQRKLKLQPVEVKALLSELTSSMQVLTVRKMQILQLYIDPQVPDLNIMADPSAMRQVLENLVSNALKFSPPDSTSRISANRVNGQVQIVISDDGPGFTDADKESLFTRYGRLSARPTGGESSTGLGLHIVHTLTQQLGGQIELQSTVGRGSTFTLSFPATLA